MRKRRPHNLQIAVGSWGLKGSSGWYAVRLIGGWRVAVGTQASHVHVPTDGTVGWL